MWVARRLGQPRGCRQSLVDSCPRLVKRPGGVLDLRPQQPGPTRVERVAGGQEAVELTHPTGQRPAGVDLDAGLRLPGEGPPPGAVDERGAVFAAADVGPDVGEVVAGSGHERHQRPAQLQREEVDAAAAVGPAHVGPEVDLGRGPEDREYREQERHQTDPRPPFADVDLEACRQQALDHLGRVWPVDESGLAPDLDHEGPPDSLGRVGRGHVARTVSTGVRLRSAAVQARRAGASAGDPAGQAPPLQLSA